MKLYTVQPQCVIDQVSKNGIVYPLSIQDTDETDSFKKAYAWLYEQMRFLGKDMGLNNGGMFWAHTRKVDCKYYKGKGLLLEINKPIEQVIISNYEMWHNTLNNSPIETDEELYNFYWEKIRPNKDKMDIYLYESWKKILDVKITKKHRIKPGFHINAWFEDSKPTVYQACFSYLKISEIVNISDLK